MRGGLVLALLVGSGLAMSGCLSSEPTANQNMQKFQGQRAPGLTPYQGPSLAIMDTPASNFTKLLCDGGVCLRQLTTEATGPANEVMVAQDYTNPSFLLAGSKDYRNDGCVSVSVYTSTDGGRTWKDGYPRPVVSPTGGPATDRCESDPVAAFDGLGNAFMMTLDTGEGIFTYRTSDQGESWEEVAMAFVGGNDKNWGATDYRINRVYSITRATCDGGEAITYSDDSGETWQGPFCFNGMDFAQVAVAPDGTVYACGVGQGGIAFAKSLDGGETWPTPSHVAPYAGSVNTPVVGGLPVLGHAWRTPVNCNMAVAMGTGAIYLAWHSRRSDQQEDVLFTASFDGGDTWKTPIVVNDDAVLADQFIPAVAASPNGDAHLIWFDGRNDPTLDGQLLDVYYAHIPLGSAAAFEDVRPDPNIRLTAESFVPYFSKHQQQPFFLGDYIGLTASNSEAVAVFPVTYNNRAENHAVIIGG